MCVRVRRILKKLSEGNTNIGLLSHDFWNDSHTRRSKGTGIVGRSTRLGECIIFIYLHEHDTQVSYLTPVFVMGVAGVVSSEDTFS